MNSTPSPVHTHIKICGLTRPEDARACHALGVDFLGLIFAASSRRIDRDQALAIRRSVPAARLVGVFADEAPDVVIETARIVELDLIQLHGFEPSDQVDALAALTGLPVIKALRCSPATAASAASDLPGRAGCDFPAASYLLFDLEKGLPGDADRKRALTRLWTAAARAARADKPVFLAGGLDSASVSPALERVAPFGIDVCSGVENAPGIKDPALVERFVMEVRRGTPST